jgi:hypothetical protein
MLPSQATCELPVAFYVMFAFEFQLACQKKTIDIYPSHGASVLLAKCHVKTEIGSQFQQDHNKITL